MGGLREDAGSLLVVEPDDRALAVLRDAAAEVRRAEPSDLDACKVIFLAVDPPALKEVLEKLAGVVAPQTLLVSLAPRVKVTTIAGALGTDRVARIIPKSPSAIRAVCDPVCISKDTRRISQAIVWRHWMAMWHCSREQS